MLDAAHMPAADRQQAKQLGQTMLDMMAGERTEVALLAVPDVLAVLIGAVHHLAGRPEDEAHDVADECADRVRDHIRANWGKISMGRSDG